MSGSGRQAPRAGGSILAGAIIAGVIGGVAVGQPSAGFLAGAAAGVIIAALLWLRDRKR